MNDNLEARTQYFGRELFARIDRQGPVLFTKAWFEDQLMGLGMHDPALKVQLFRFVDTLPYLKENRDVSRHLREYLAEAEGELPGWVRRGMRLLPRDGFLSSLLAFAARTGATRMARKFIAGSNVAEALQAIHTLRTRRLGFTIDLLGEATIAENEADRVQQQYLALLHGLTQDVNQWPEEAAIDRDDRGPIPRVNVSVKLSALYSQFDPIDPAGTSRAVRARLRPILQLAKKTGAFVNFDMEQYSFKDETLRIFREVLNEPEFRDWPHVGIAMQAYLHDTGRDLEQLRDWVRDERRCPVWVRLVKGAYWDYETVIAAQNGWEPPVFLHKWQSDANYERLSEFLLGNVDWLIPAFGSHNLRSIAHAMAAAESLGVPRRRFEFQMLYGMADAIKDAIQSFGYRLRIYTPYGQLLPGMAYLVRRLLENSSNDSFLRQGFAEHLSEEVLLMNPIEHGRAGSVSDRSQHEPAAHTPRSPFHNEPPTDFARESSRAEMHEALDKVRSQLGRDYPAFLNGRTVPFAK
ncbi:MAG TPA: proline dehydrogenase family protein, partial [Gemmataceae bacterium]